jgi:hypothetical protein
MGISIVPKVTCDSCGVEKQETNHWWMIKEYGIREGLLVQALGLAGHDAIENERVACGESCCLKLVSQMLDRIASR